MVEIWHVNGQHLGTIEDIRSHPLLAKCGSLGYIVDVFKQPGEDAVVVAGSSDGSLVTFAIEGTTPYILSAFDSERAHNAVVRCAYTTSEGIIYTGGEDGCVFEWSIGTIERNPDRLRAPASKSRQPRANPY